MDERRSEVRLIDAIRSAVGDRIAYVCFSGGIDSTVVLAGCARAGVDTVALIGVSDSLPAAELEDAHRIARELGVRVEEVRRSEEHTSELQSQSNLVCRLLLEKKKKKPLRDTDVTDVQRVK